MRRTIVLLTILITALLVSALATHVANASPRYKRSPSINTNVVMTYTFPITETGVDSLAFEVNGLCSVVYESAGSDDASLYAVPTSETATGSGTLIVAYTDSSTVPTVFQPGTRWVRAVAVSAATGGSVMRITCSNTQMASTGEACIPADSGLAPYVGSGGRYKCEADYFYTEATNQLTVGEVAVTAAVGENAIRMEANSAFSGDDPTSTEVLLYGLTGDTELYVENLDGLGAPSRVVTASPDYYDVVLSWGVAFKDVDNEYAVLGAAGAQIVDKFCMVKSAHAEPGKSLSSAGESGDVDVPLTGLGGCSANVSATAPKVAYALMGDPYIKDSWCTAHSGPELWATGDEVVVRFGVSNNVDLFLPEYLISAHDMAYGYDEIFIYKGEVDRHSELREAVDGLSSSFFTEAIDAGGLKMVLYTASIESMTRAVGSTWNVFHLQCSLGIVFKDTR